MADWFATLPPAAWLLFLLLVAAIPLMVCTALVIVAFIPSGAGRAGWRNPLRVPGREGIVAWSEMHPAFPRLVGQRSLVGYRIPVPEVQPRSRWPLLRAAIPRVVTDLQRIVAQLLRSPLLRPGRPSGDSA